MRKLNFPENEKSKGSRSNSRDELEMPQPGNLMPGNGKKGRSHRVISGGYGVVNNDLMTL